MSKIYVDEIAGIASADTVAIPGHVIQVYQVIKTDTFSMAGATWTDITDLSITVTPSSASSKFLLSASINCSPSNSPISYWANFRFTKDGTSLTVADTSGTYRQEALAGKCFPSSIAYEADQVAFTELNTASTTSSITYKVQTMTPYAVNGTELVYVNRSERDSDTVAGSGGFDSRYCSTFTIMEIAG